MIITRGRPTTLPATILVEIACADEDQRFRACEAICASIWAVGLNTCRLPVERALWLERYAEYLAVLTEVWTRETTPRP